VRVQGRAMGSCPFTENRVNEKEFEWICKISRFEKESEFEDEICER